MQLPFLRLASGPNFLCMWQRLVEGWAGIRQGDGLASSNIWQIISAAFCLCLVWQSEYMDSVIFGIRFKIQSTHPSRTQHTIANVF